MSKIMQQSSFLLCNLKNRKRRDLCKKKRIFWWSCCQRLNCSHPVIFSTRNISCSWQLFLLQLKILSNAKEQMGYLSYVALHIVITIIEIGKVCWNSPDNREKDTAIVGAKITRNLNNPWNYWIRETHAFVYLLHLLLWVRRCLWSMAMESKALPSTARRHHYHSLI